MRKFAFIIILAAAAAVPACTTQETPAPPLTGPSEFALRIALQSIPDSILQDGASQAAIQIEASGPDGRAVRALPLRIETSINGTLQDYGTLSTRSVVTGEDGRARVVYTAPPRPADSTGSVTVVTFLVTPVTSDFRSVEPRTVDLRLVPPGVILPPNAPPAASFTFNPASPLPMQDIMFDASESTDEGAACGARCTYQWEFGDTNTATGVFVRHQYRTGGTYGVRLTVTDPRGASHAVTRQVTVGTTQLPTASFTMSPSNPQAGQAVLFNAAASTAQPGRRLVRYDWSFGTGHTSEGVTATHAYSAPGRYIVQLVVTDDAGQRSNPAVQEITVGNVANLTASLTVSPASSASAPAPLSTTFVFDASGSTAGDVRIVEYRFNMGDGSPEGVQTTQPSWAHQYRAAGIYTVRLTVRDAQGRTASTTRTVYVQ